MKHKIKQKLGQQPQYDENGEIIATIEGHNEMHDTLQPEEAEAIDHENAGIIHDDQQPLTGFGGAAVHSTSMSSFGNVAQVYNTDSMDR